MKKSLLLIYCLFTTLVYAQNNKGFFLETEFLTKISANQPTTVNVFRGLIFDDIPEKETYSNPLFGISFSGFYAFNKNIALGLGVGINICKTDVDKENPALGYDKINVPATFTARFTLPLKNHWFLFSDLRGGYQYSENQSAFEQTISHFLIRESGGAFYGIDLGFGRQNKKYSPMLKLGYEIYASNQVKAIGYYTDFGLSISQDISYVATYNLFKIGFAVKM